MFLPGAVGRQVGVSIGAEVAQADEGFAAGVFDFDSSDRCVVADEDLVFGVLTEADHGRGLEGQFADPTLALDGGPTACCTVLQDGLGSWFDGQFFGAKELLAIDGTVDDPFVADPCGGLGRIDDRFDVVGIFEVGIDVLFPVELTHDEVEVLMLVFRHVLDQQGPGHIAAFDDRLEHPEDVRAPLGFVGAQGSWCVQNAWWNQPTGTALEAIGSGEIEDSVVPSVPVFQAAPELVFGGARFEPHEGVGEVVIDVVVLGWEVVALGLAFLTDQSGILLGLMHVVGDWAHVVEEFRVDRPAVVFAEDGFADEPIALFGDGVFEEEFFALEKTEAQSFVPDASLVGRFGGACEPTFIDSAAIGAESIEVVGVEFDSATWVQEASRDPGRGQSKDAIAGVEGFVQDVRYVIGLDQTII